MRYRLTRSESAELACLHDRLINGAPRGEGVVQWRNKTIRYTSASALFYQLSDIYIERSYDFLFNGNPTILDVGANHGIAVRRYRERFPNAKIIAFEPDPTIYKVLVENVRNHWCDPATQLLQAAAWTTQGVTHFNATGSDTGSIDPGGSIEVTTVDLAHHCAAPVDFLKIDVEGAEQVLLQHLADTNALSNVRRLFIELHHWVAGPMAWHETLGILDRCGFEYRLKADNLGQPRESTHFDNLPYPAALAAVYAWKNT